MSPMNKTLALDWHVQYYKDSARQVEWHFTPGGAIEGACRLIDEGCDVFGIGTGSFSDSIARDQIDKIYATWVRAKFAFGIIPIRDPA